MKEGEWTRKLCEYWRQHNALCFSVVANRYAEPGWPDRYVSHTLWSGWIEFKNPDTLITPVQRRIICELRKRKHGHAFIVRRQTEEHRKEEEVVSIFTDPNTCIEVCTVKDLLRTLARNSEEV